MNVQFSGMYLVGLPRGEAPDNYLDPETSEGQMIKDIVIEHEGERSQYWAYPNYIPKPAKDDPKDLIVVLSNNDLKTVVHSVKGRFEPHTKNLLRATWEEFINRFNMLLDYEDFLHSLIEAAHQYLQKNSSRVKAAHIMRDGIDICEN